MKRLLALVAVAFFSASQTGIHPQPFEWKQGSSMIAAARNGSAVVCDGKIYFMGGNGYDNLNSFAYDPATDTWTGRSRMRTMGWNAAIGSAYGKIYVFGGDPFRDRSEVYDPSDDSWHALKPMPTPRQHLKCGVVDSRIYVLGGLEQGTVTRGASYTTWDGRALVSAKNEMYDPTTDSWTERAPMPVPMHSPNAFVAVAEGRIYVMDGMGDNVSIWTDLTVVEAYDTQTDTWTVRKQLPFPCFTGSAVVDDTLYALGATPEGQGKIARYDGVADEWEILGDLPVVKVQAGVVSLRSSIYILAGNGFDDYTATSTVHQIIFPMR